MGETTDAYQCRQTYHVAGRWFTCTKPRDHEGTCGPAPDRSETPAPVPPYGTPLSQPVVLWALDPYTAGELRGVLGRAILETPHSDVQRARIDLVNDLETGRTRILTGTDEAWRYIRIEKAKEQKDGGTDGSR